MSGRRGRSPSPSYGNYGSPYRGPPPCALPRGSPQQRDAYRAYQPTEPCQNPDLLYRDRTNLNGQTELRSCVPNTPRNQWNVMHYNPAATTGPLVKQELETRSRTTCNRMRVDVEGGGEPPKVWYETRIPDPRTGGNMIQTHDQRGRFVKEVKEAGYHLKPGYY